MRAPVGPPPSPDEVTTLDALTIRLGALRRWADVPLRTLRDLVDELRRARGVPDEHGRRPSYGAVQALFQQDRLRLDEALLLDVVRALLDRQAPSEEWREQQVDLWRAAHLAASGQPVESGHVPEFRLGPLTSPCRILEGDGERTIAEENVHVLVNPVDVTLPEEVGEWRTQIAVEQQRRRLAGDGYMWNARRYAVENFVISRSGPAERPDVTLRLKHSDYYAFLAAQQLNRPLRGGATLRNLYLDGRDPRAVPDFMRSSFGLNVALVTADDWLVVSHRGHDVAVGRNQWNASANEGLQRDLDGPQPNLFHAAARGVQEELRLDPDQYDLRMLAFVVVTSLSQWCGLFLARLHEMTRQDFEDNAGRGIADGWEHSRFDYVRFTPEETIGYLVREDRRDSWAPAAPVLFYLSLVNTYGRRRVDDVLTSRAATTPG